MEMAENITRDFGGGGEIPHSSFHLNVSALAQVKSSTANAPALTSAPDKHWRLGGDASESAPIGESP